MNKNDRYDSLFQYYAGENNLDWLLIKAQCRAESAFDPNAQSPVGASGLMQFMPYTWNEWRDGTPGIDTVVYRNDTVMKVQKALKGRGFDPGPIDGLFGTRTSAALEAYQGGIGLYPITGELNQRTLTALGISDNELIDPRDPEDSIFSGCAYMRWLLRQFEQDYRRALAAYNWGIGNVRRLLANTPDGEPWVSRLPNETQNYIATIYRYYNEYLHERLSRRPT